uniref:Uncharacterized protein n=1 Tax=Rhizophora mucronata TaxID=61149 RepID=A0A2P2NXH8_RHIMU
MLFCRLGCSHILFSVNKVSLNSRQGTKLPSCAWLNVIIIDVLPWLFHSKPTIRKIEG